VIAFAIDSPRSRFYFLPVVGVSLRSLFLRVSASFVDAMLSLQRAPAREDLGGIKSFIDIFMDRVMLDISIAKCIGRPSAGVLFRSLSLIHAFFFFSSLPTFYASIPF